MAAPQFADRVVETTQTTGTGTLDLDGASTGFRTFVAGLGNGTLAAYVITDGVEWETGSGIVTDASPDTLSRVTVSASSNGGSQVNWTNNNKNERDVFCAPLAEFISAFEAGTVMMFHQSAAPAGWTKDVAATLDDSALRIVTSTTWVSGQGGATVFSSVFGSSKNSGAYTLETADIPSHAHDMKGNVPVTSGGATAFATAGAGGSTEATGGGGSHLHTLSLDLNYINMILASKD